MKGSRFTFPLETRGNTPPLNCFSSNFYVNGIEINRFSFVDDVIEFNEGIDQARQMKRALIQKYVKRKCDCILKYPNAKS